MGVGDGDGVAPRVGEGVGVGRVPPMLPLGFVPLVLVVLLGVLVGWLLDLGWVMMPLVSSGAGHPASAATPRTSNKGNRRAARELEHGGMEAHFQLRLAPGTRIHSVHGAVAGRCRIELVDVGIERKPPDSSRTREGGARGNHT